ncbi:MAG: glyoxalase/bleomycin resistance/extradiol dioxygenase family protein [Acidobacteria bacterium]|nr:MAG: glyoxalase/bleomycin resistance/extradiol dioxygenase family protein [Acidobacteriota bacterium]
MFKLAIPVLHVSSSVVAEEFYCDHLGFRRESAYRPSGDIDPCHMSLVRDDVRLHVSSFSGDAVSGGVVYLRVDDIDGLHEELLQKNVSIDTGPINQEWGNREMYLKDSDGNSIRFFCPNI